MNVTVHKYLIFGAKDQMDRFFELAQRAGFLEFIGVSHKKSLELTDDIKIILAAIKLAKQHEVHPDQAPVLHITPVELATKLVALNKMREELLEEKRILTAEIARIAPFGDFSKEDLQAIESDAKRVIQFFCMKSDLAREITMPPEVIFVGTEYDLDYFIAINKEPKTYPKMIEIQIEHPVGELHHRLQVVTERIASIESDVRHYSNALGYLQAGLADLLNDFHLMLTKHDAALLLDKALFAIEAWVPETKIKALFGLISGLDICAEEIGIEPNDRIPTCLENKGVARIGEDLVHVYDTPSPTDADPSMWVLIFFSIFFAIIISDAGYGILYLILAFVLQFKFPKMPAQGRRFTKLVFILSSCCILWGISTASFFGIDIGPNNPYRKMSFLHALARMKAEYHVEHKDDVYQEYVREYPAVATATDGHDFLLKASGMEDGKVKYYAQEDFYDNLLMELSLMIGVFHLSLSFLRYLLRNWAGLGWVFFMVGGYLFFPKVLEATTLVNITGLISKETAYAVGEQMVYGGIGLAFVLALFQKKWGAFHELMNVIQVFSDVISYIRLYALALAGMVVAATFNKMGMEVGIFGGLFIILAGHASNIAMSTMGAGLHSLRLNFLEWYRYSFEGGGRLFNPLRLRKRDKIT